MSDNHLLRATRNTLLDMLMESRGTTFPLADVPVEVITGAVTFGENGQIKINYNQPDVVYQVFEGNKPFSDQVLSNERKGLKITTKPLKGESHAFRIEATKRWYGPGELPKDKELLKNVLYQVVNIKVGVNVDLEVVASETTLDYAEKAILTIKKPQERVFYQIVCTDGDSYTPLSDEVLCENVNDVVINTSTRLREDIILLVRARDPHTQLTGILKMGIPVMVKPVFNLSPLWEVRNADKATEVIPALNYGDRASIRLPDSQKSAKYRLFLKKKDGENISEDWESNWIGQELRGKDGDLELKVTGELKEDAMIGIVVKKDSCLPEGGELVAKVFIPVKPKAITQLKAVSGESEDDENTYIRITGAQPGVIYQLYRHEDNQPVGEPVFYHRNLGIGNIRVGGEYIADNYRAANWWENWVPSEFVLDEITVDEKNILLLPAGEVKTTTSFYIIAKKSTTGFTETLPPVTVTVA